METLTKNYRDNAEIELAWQELIAALKPVNKKEIKSTKITSVAHHHPALITTSEFANWEMLG